MAATRPGRDARDQRFAEAEADMPQLPSRFKTSLVDKVTSYLGHYNPFAKTYNPATDALWLLDNVAYRDPKDSGAWTAEFVAAYFLKDSGTERGEVVAYIAERLGVPDGSRAEETVRERVKPFVDSILPARTVEVLVGKEEKLKLKLGPSGRNGISADQETLRGFEQRRDGDVVKTVAAVGEQSAEMGMITHFVEPEGWTVISDVDDTIKITLTPSPLGILKSTFVDEPTVAAGMPELYEHLKTKLSPNFFYLSASPYNLYPFLRAFLHSAPYPSGPLILRDASWMNLAGFLASLTQGTQSYKVSRMRKIHAWLPRRKIICIGDSTQSDPEAYAELYRAYPGWVKRIWIRKVSGVADLDLQEEEEENGDARFEKAFAGVPADVWKVFVEPGELQQAVEELGK
ncbi:MAG: hypothetical protein M1832_001101 [Thelocarpon impressellum]|nr:MAG: hypothetical protein M1832_001101 [Thelocarpon impressellum]